MLVDRSVQPSVLNSRGAPLSGTQVSFLKPLQDLAETYDYHESNQSQGYQVKPENAKAKMKD